jgi:hypothetical protein
MSSIDRGSPSSDEALTAIALTRGDASWRLGRVGEAMRAFRAGIPPSDPAALPSADDLAAVDDVPALARTFEWREEAAIGDVRRLLYLEGLVLRAAGRPLGDTLVNEALARGLSAP